MWVREKVQGDVRVVVGKDMKCGDREDPGTGPDQEPCTRARQGPHEGKIGAGVI